MDRWKQIDEVFAAALERAPAERAAFLDAACAGDAELRREVESLLAADSGEGGLLETGVLGVAAGLLAAEAAEDLTGRQIGQYRVVRELGRGGMGTVYEAARADSQFKKRVALKVVRRGMDTEDILSRFRHERQILASLDHPNIARLLDGGTTPDGLPYFVMEFIEGQPLTDYCDTHRLSTAERLRLFRTVCDAVQFAHQNLVIHRDIKPSNILVTPDGTPKLLDFGIAKVLRPDFFPHTVAPTARLVRPMTPDYASPEQVRGLPVTTATDIYSLGVLLYEMLTGRKPYRVRGTSVEEIERAICETEPERPSDAIADSGLRTADSGRQAADSDSQSSDSDSPAGEGARDAGGVRGAATKRQSAARRARARNPQPAFRNPKSLRGDLDNICLTALRKEPQRRYASVEQFSEDIRRHLEGLPVRARKDTFHYRASKFVRRHRVGVAAAVLLAALLLSFGVYSSVQSRRVARERERAERVSAFLQDLFRVSDPGESRGNSITARELLDRGAERINSELRDEPEVRAELMYMMGSVYESLGLFERALPLIEQSLATRRALHGAEHEDVAESMYGLALVQWNRGKHEESERLHRESLATRRKLHGPDHPSVGQSLNGLGDALDSQAKRDEAVAVWREALEMRRRLFAGDHPDVAESLHNLGWGLYQKGEYAEAERMVGEALEMHRRLYRGGDHPLIAADLNVMGFVMHMSKRPAESERLYREGLEMRRRVFGPQHWRVSESLNNLAWSFSQQGRYPEAEQFYREALEMRRKTLGPESREYSQSLNNVAKVLMQQDKYAEAEPLMRESLDIARRSLGDDHPETARSAANLAELLYEEGRPGDSAEAERLFRHALARRGKGGPERNATVATALVGLARILSDRGDAKAAEPLLREGLDIRRDVLADGHWQTAETASLLGDCLAALGRHAEAEPLLSEGHATLRAKRGDDNRRTQAAAARLFRLYTALNQPERAAQYRPAKLSK